MPESSRATGGTLSRALAAARDALTHAPAGLLTDFDGTLSPIVTDPALARPAEGVVRALEALSAHLAVVAIVTGRAPLDARRMLGAGGVLIAGNHGTEWLEPDAAEPRSSLDTARIRSALDLVLARLPMLPGVPVEAKGLSASVHYRNAPDPIRAHELIIEALGDVGAHGIELRHGRMSVELRPIGAGDKGSGTREIVERYALRGAIVLGDDVTDLDMFEAVLALRRAGHIRAAVIGVGGGDGEVPAAVTDAADVVLADPDEAAALLEELAADAVAGRLSP